MSNPVILSAQFTDNSAIRLHGNLLFATHHNQTTTFTLLLDYPLTSGAYVFKIGSVIIPTHSISPINYLGSTQITVVVNNSELVNRSGLITIFKPSTHITVNSSAIYSKKPTITSCSHEVMTIDDTSIITLHGTGFDSKSYISLFTYDTYSYIPVYNIEPLSSSTIVKLEFILSKVQIPDLECGVFYIAVVSPSSPILTSTIPNNAVSKTLPLGDDQLFSVSKLAIRPVIYSILNREVSGGMIPGDKPVVPENAADYIITSGKAHMITVIGSHFKRNCTSIAVYQDLSGQHPLFFLSEDSSDIHYVDPHTLLLHLPPIHIFRKLFFRATIHNYAKTDIASPSNDTLVGRGGSTISSLLYENKTLFVMPQILISNHILTASPEPEFWINEPSIKIQVSNLFDETPSAPNFQLYYKIPPSSSHSSFTLSQYRIGFSIPRGHNTINTNAVRRNTDYLQFMTDATAYFQTANQFAVDVFIQITFDLQERELLLNSNVVRILFRSTPEEEAAPCLPEPVVEHNVCHPHHIQESHSKRVAPISATAGAEICTSHSVYVETLSAIALDAGFDFAHHDEYLKTVQAYQVNSTTSRAHILAAFHAAYFQLTGHGQGIRLEGLPTLQIPFSAQHIQYTNPQIGQIIQKMMDTIPSHTNPLLHHSIQGMCSHILVTILYVEAGKGYTPFLQYALPDSLTVSDANVSLLFAEQIAPTIDSYMLSPYVDINHITQNLSIDGGLPILEQMNQLLTYGISGDLASPELASIRDQVASTIDQWIAATAFILVSDGGKYAGSSYMANIDSLASHYIQTIHSALVGNPNVNIIADSASIAAALQAGNGQTTLGAQFANEILDNASTICRALLQADHTRQPPENSPVLFRSNDRLIVYVTVSGSIENPDIDLRALFSKNIDPLADDSTSFKRYALNHLGTQIKPIKYALILPLG